MYICIKLNIRVRLSSPLVYRTGYMRVYELVYTQRLLPTLYIIILLLYYMPITTTNTLLLLYYTDNIVRRVINHSASGRWEHNNTL